MTNENRTGTGDAQQVALVVVDWLTLYEKSDTKKQLGELRWFSMPTAFDRLFYRVMGLADGSSIWGCFVVVLQLAARMPSRGMLCDRHGPLTVADICIMSRVNEAQMSRAVDVLVDFGLLSWQAVANETGEPGASLKIVDADQSGGTPSGDPRIVSGDPRKPPESSPTSPAGSSNAAGLQDSTGQDTTDSTDMSVRDVPERDERARAGKNWGQASAVLTKILHDLHPATDADWLILEQASIAVADGLIAEAIVMGARDAVKYGRKVERPFGLFIDQLKAGCLKAFVPFGLITTLEVPPGWNARTAIQSRIA